jgi:hypothetical protein
VALLAFETYQSSHSAPLSMPRNIVGNVSALQRFQVE